MDSFRAKWGNRNPRAPILCLVAGGVFDKGSKAGLIFKNRRLGRLSRHRIVRHVQHALITALTHERISA